MKSYLFYIELGDFCGTPGESAWNYNVTQQLNVFIQAETLDQATREIQNTYGDYSRCRYYFKGEE